MEILYTKDVHIVEIVQAKFINCQELMISISKLFDPRNAFLLYIPILFSLDFKAGRKLMFAVIMMEWSNHLLKWLLHGERPYWWVQETSVYNSTGVPTPIMLQFSITCETSPGSPSGHSQSTAAVWYVLIHTFLQKYDFSSRDGYNLIPKIGWLIYFFLLAAVGISRVFIAAHFPHQCLFGMALGWAISVSLGNINQLKCSALQYSAITAGMFASAVFVYMFLGIIGSDPMWTIDRAMKWCADPENIHLDTTPLYSMMRYCGFMFGMGFGFNSSYFQRNYQMEFSAPMKVLCTLLSVSMCLLSEQIAFNRESLFLYYFQAFVLNTFRAYILIALIPTAVASFWTLKKKIQ